MYELFKTQQGYFFTDFFWLLFILAACFVQKELLMMGKNLDTTQFLLVQDCMWFKQNVVDTQAVSYQDGCPMFPRPEICVHLVMVSKNGAGVEYYFLQTYNIKFMM